VGKGYDKNRNGRRAEGKGLSGTRKGRGGGRKVEEKRERRVYFE